MLENDALVSALVKNISYLQEQLHTQTIDIALTEQLDMYYTDGSASGSFFKISPFGFYYNYKGELHFAGLTYDYKTYGRVIEEWIAAVRGEPLALVAQGASASANEGRQCAECNVP